MDALLNALPEESRASFRVAIEAAIASATAAAVDAATASIHGSREAEREFRDIAKTIATVIKPSKPKPFQGNIDAEECLNFLDCQAAYYEAVLLPQTQWVTYTALMLEGSAQSWWRNSGLTKTTPWDEFQKAFLAYFTPPDTVNKARREIEQLQQGKTSIAAYTEKFRRLLRLIPNLDAESILFRYTQGLEKDTKLQVLLRAPDTLDEAVVMATRIYGTFHPSEPIPQPSSPQHSPSNPVPMDLDNLRIMLNALGFQPRQQRQRRFNRQPLDRLPDDERLRLYQRGACFKCRKDGHISRDCPTKNRSFNNIDINEGSLSDNRSGNASSD